MHRLLVPALLLPLALLGLLSLPQEQQAAVARVIDGDTVVLVNGIHVRLLGIDTPEKGQPFAAEAARFLEEQTLGKAVRLEPGLEDKDKYNRTLRYVFLDGRNLDLELVQRGLARPLIFQEDQHAVALRAAGEAARASGQGIWSIPPDAFCVGIFSFHYNAKGNDNENLADEYATFRNACPHPVNLTGWTVSDRQANTYRFPLFLLMNKTHATLHTGSGRDNETDLYWGQSSPVWGNSGDQLLAWDADGRLMLNYSYA